MRSIQPAKTRSGQLVGQMIRFPAAALLVVLFGPASVFAPDAAPAAPTGATGQGVTFSPATQPLPAPFLSCSGRFSSLNPPVLSICRNSRVTGRVLTTRSIRVGQFECEVLGSRSTSGTNGMTLDRCLMNVELNDPADAAKMVIGKDVTISGDFTDAFENHGGYPVNYLIAKNAKIMGSEQSGPPDAPAQASTSVMECQPPQLDGLASELGRELCVQSTLVSNLNVIGPALAAAARAPLPGPPRDAASGDPSTITCRIDPEHSDAHLTAIACARNNYWAWWVRKQQNPVGYGIEAPP